MNVIWWILPGLAGVIGLMLTFALAGLNLQTYQRLTYEQAVATVSFDKTPGADDTYSVTFVQTGTDDDTRVIGGFKGDEFSLGAQVITFEPVSQLLGYNSVYRLDYLEGRYASRYNTASVSEATSVGIKLFENPGLDVHTLAGEEGQLGVKRARFGSAVYAPMADGLKYDISITQTALVLKPANEAAKRQLRQQSQTD